MIAAATYIYVQAGATEPEADCLAPIAGRGKHQVSEAFDAPTDAQTAAAVKCVGSEARLRVIGNGLAADAERKVKDMFGSKTTTTN